EGGREGDGSKGYQEFLQSYGVYYQRGEEQEGADDYAQIKEATLALSIVFGVFNSAPTQGEGAIQGKICAYYYYYYIVTVEGGEDDEDDDIVLVVVVTEDNSTQLLFFSRRRRIYRNFNRIRRDDNIIIIIIINTAIANEEDEEEEDEFYSYLQLLAKVGANQFLFAPSIRGDVKKKSSQCLCICSSDIEQEEDEIIYDGVYKTFLDLDLGCTIQGR
ncbi:MAG: hypothetical protein EZS28_027710, partial [Streblomastix strix]